MVHISPTSPTPEPPFHMKAAELPWLLCSSLPLFMTMPSTPLFPPASPFKVLYAVDSSLTRSIRRSSCHLQLIKADLINKVRTIL